MDVDYLVFSGHKIGGPSGVGVLWINPRALHTLKPIQWGWIHGGQRDVKRSHSKT
jgi:selenocysteine lyase/cysteine desulfurase